MPVVELDDSVLQVLQHPALAGLLRPYVPPVPAPAIFEFDTAGVTEGFAGSYFRDDTDNVYGPAMAVTQFPLAQYGKKFPLPSGTTPPYGTLSVFADQLFPASFNFPQKSAYWYHDVFSPNLAVSPAWQQLKGVEAWFLDSASALDKSHISAEIRMSVTVNGALQTVVLGPTQLSKKDWTKVGGPVTLGQGMVVHNLVIRVKGEWAQSSLPGKARPKYSGYVLIDHVAAL